MHDDLSFGRSLHASRRSRPVRISRRPIVAHSASERRARYSRAVLTLPGALPSRAEPREARPPFRAAAKGRTGSEAARGHARPRAPVCARQFAVGGPTRAGHDPGRRQARPRRHSRRVRTVGARSRHQRSCDPASSPLRRRGRASAERGLLWRARPPHGPRGGVARFRAGKRRRVGAAHRRQRARCDPRHDLGLRHNDQGLRLHAAARSSLCGEGEAHRRAR